MTTALDINQFVYRTGTLTIAPGDTTAVFTDTALQSGPVRDGDLLIAGNGYSVIQTVTSDTEADLFLPWAGAAVTNVQYVIFKSSLLRYQPALAAVDSGELLAKINETQIIYSVTGSAPDPSIGKEGDFALKSNSGVWLFWKFVSGVWELQATPVGTNWRGQWDSATEYLQNDMVGRLGSSYIAKEDNTNLPPESNPTQWDLAASKGDPGRDGGVIAIPYTFDGSTNADTKPANGKLRLGPGANQFGVTVWRVNPIDSQGLDWTGTITDMAVGSSTVKCAARLYRVVDQTKRIVANVTSIVAGAGGGYYNFTLSATSGDTNPFTDGDEFVLVLDRNGDKGDMPVLKTTSTSSVAVGTGVKTFTVPSGLAFNTSQRLRVANADSTRVMVGPVTSYTGTSLQITVDDIVGSGTDNAWNIAITGEKGLAPVVTGTSTSSVSVGTGSKAFTTQTGMTIATSQRLRIANADSSRVMVGTVTSYTSNTGALVMNIDDIAGTGTDTAWFISIAGEKGLAPVLSGTSTSSVAVGTGAQTFTTQTGLAFSVAQRLSISNADASRVMVGTVTSYTSNTGSLVMNIDETIGTGTDNAWVISVAGKKGLKGDKAAQWRGSYNAGTAYVTDDWVGFGGKLYIAKQASTGQQPDTSPTYWDLQIDTSALILSFTVQPVSSNFTALASDRAKMFRVTSTATIALTAAATLGNGWFCIVKGDGASATIDPDSTEQIDGADTLTLGNGSSAIIICDGSAFYTFRTSSGGGSLSSVVESIKTADYSVQTTDLGTRVVMNSTSARTVTALSPATAGAGFAHFVRNINTGMVTISATMDNGDTSFKLDTGDEVLLTSTGSAWRKQLWRTEGFWESETDVATASTMDIGATNTERVRATGSTNVTSFGSRANKIRTIRWTSAITVTHNGTSLILPTASNLTTASGDIWHVGSDSAGNWRVYGIQKADGTAVIGGMTDAERRNALLDRIYLSKALASYRRSVSAIAIGFSGANDTANGIDTGSSSNYSVAPSFGNAAPSTGASSDTTTTGNAISGGDNASSNKTNAFDNSSSTAWWSLQTGTGIPGVAYIGQNYGAGVTKNITSMTIQQGSVSGTNFIVTSWKVQYSSNGTTWFDAATITPALNTTAQSFSWASVGAFQYWRLLANAAPTQGGATTAVDEVQFFEPLTNNMTLVTASQTSDVTVSNGRVLIEYDNLGSPTLNTDLTVEVSCNGGTNWSAATLAQVGTGQAGRIVAEVADTVCTAGTSFKARIKTFNNKLIPIYGLSLTVH